MSDEQDLVFLDTNVLIYAHDRSAGDKHLIAREILANLWRNERGCTSIQVLQEFYTVAIRKLPYAKAADVRGIVSDLTKWTVHSPTPHDILAAIGIHERYQISFWDAMVIHSAMSLGCTTLWTEDLSAGQMIGSLQIRNPFAR